MKKIGVLLIVVGLIFSISTVNAEFAKEGRGDYRMGKSGIAEVIKMGEKSFQMNWSETGVTVLAPENSPFYNASFHFMGTLYSVEGKFKATGAGVFTAITGDKIYGTLVTEKVSGTAVSGGSMTFTGGTGEFEGITGGLEVMPRPGLKPSKEGTYQSLGIGKVFWKIP